MIILKKINYFFRDVLFTELQYKIPFKLTDQSVDLVIKTLLDKEHIVFISENIYKYSE